MLKTQAVPWCVWTLLGVAAGCGGSSKDSGGASEPAEDVRCGEPVDRVVAGLSIPCDDGGCSLTFVELEPLSPDRGDNTWTVQVDDAATPVRGLTVAPFMPAHNHGTAPADFEGEPLASDTWTVGPFDLFMPGRWEARLTLDFDDGTSTEAVTAFCVEG